MRKFHTLTRKLHTSTKINNKIIEMKGTDFKDKDSLNTKYSESLFNILEKIKDLTSTPYEPKEVQQLIENHWTVITKENYKGNIHKHIEIMNPKLYIVFLLRNMQSIKKVFNTLYVFFNDIRLYLITFNVITQFFRRSSTTKIANLISEHLLIHIYKCYFIPRVLGNSKYIQSTQKEFQDEFLINKFKNKIKKGQLLELMEFLDKESLDLAENQIEIIIKAISLRLFEDENYLFLNPNKIKFKDFVEEVCYYSVDKKKNKKLKINMN